MNSVNAIEIAARRLDKGLRLLQAVKEVKDRRQMARDDVGPLIGALDKAMEAAVADREEHVQWMYGVVRTKIIAQMSAVLMRACEWKLEDKS
jgi:hypothetical protein